jgi:hypothetical protein
MDQIRGNRLRVSRLRRGDPEGTVGDSPLTLDRSWLTTESPTPVPPPVDPRCLQMASSSSKMMMCRPDSSPFALY